MSKKNFLEKLNDILSPFAYKLANQRHLKAISSGMFFSLPFMVIGAFFLIIANPPINMDNFDFSSFSLFKIKVVRFFETKYFRRVFSKFSFEISSSMEKLGSSKL